MTKRKVLEKAAELGVIVEQRRDPVTKEWEVDLLCEPEREFTAHGLTTLAVWSGFDAPDWNYIYNELIDAEVSRC